MGLGTDICKDMLPSVCGSSNLPTAKDIPCGDIRFTGITDMTVPQGRKVDLAEGVHAYDSKGREVDFTYSPKSVDTTVVGEYLVEYKPIAVIDTMIPTICGDVTFLHMTECTEEPITVYRTITVTEGTMVCDAKVCESFVNC